MTMAGYAMRKNGNESFDKGVIEPFFDDFGGTPVPVAVTNKRSIAWLAKTLQAGKEWEEGSSSLKATTIGEVRFYSKGVLIDTINYGSSIFTKKGVANNFGSLPEDFLDRIARLLNDPKADDQKDD